MLTLFFTIIFLAEIIVAGWVISWIIKLDKKVCETNKKMLEFQPKMREQIKQVDEKEQDKVQKKKIRNYEL